MAQAFQCVSGYAVVESVLMIVFAESFQPVLYQVVESGVRFFRVVGNSEVVGRVA